MEHTQLPSTSPTAPAVEATTSRSALPSYIPQEQYAGKMLIVCFDGTGNEFNTDNSNIVQLVSMLERDDKTKQMVYYQVRLSFFYDPYIDSWGTFVAWHWDVPLKFVRWLAYAYYG